MFENYKEMSADEKARVKQIHKSIRKDAASREGNLAWAFVRGFPYRRVERQTRTQTMPDGTIVQHNPPRLVRIATLLVAAMPELETQYLKGKYQIAPECPLDAWVKDPSGAVPAPVREPRKPYVRTEVA